jgi:hypothetical protein
VEAKLGLYAASRSSTAGLTAQAYRVGRAWLASQTTWNQATSVQAWAVAGCNGLTDRDSLYADQKTVNATGAWYELNVTGLVQGWINDAGSNLGMLVQATGGTAVQYNMCSSKYPSFGLRPRLVVTYR